MANPEHLAILKQGVEQWNKWRKRHPDVTPDLGKASLREANLNKADLSASLLRWADLGGASLREAILIRADLSEADLHRVQFNRADLKIAKLRGADLSWADLRGADLGGADLCEANFTRANLRRAHLVDAEFSGALAWRTQFDDADLSVAKGLETVRHLGPSTIGIDTIYKSRGKIPVVFLRGCGVPDEFIAYIGSMVGRPIEYFSCFISYSSLDQDFADRLYADLQAKGVRSWFAPHDIRGGRKIHEQIDEAIRLHDKLLLILSEHSMSSNWVKTEIANAREREEREKKQLLFPITLAGLEDVKHWKLFDADRGVDSAREIREFYIPDFSNWKDHDSYQAAFQRLLSDLKAEGSG